MYCDLVLNSILVTMSSGAFDDTSGVATLLEVLSALTKVESSAWTNSDLVSSENYKKENEMLVLANSHCFTGRHGTS